MYVFAYIITVIADRVRMEDVISVILCALYCYVFSPEVILPIMSLLCLFGSCVLEEACLRRVICMEGGILCFQS